MLLSLDSPELSAAMDNRTPNHRSDHPPTDCPSSGPDHSADATAKIRKLKSSAGGGLFTIASFIGLSIVAVVNLQTLSKVPASFRAVLGTGPTPLMISAVLIIYSFSAILMTLSRMSTGAGSYGGFAHLGYLSGFYVFYYFSDSLAENFWAVFAAGLTILGLEGYQRWNWCMEEIRRITEEGVTSTPEDQGE